MWSWVVSVGLIVIISTIITIILPDSRVSGIVFVVLGVMIISVIIKPIITVKDDIDFTFNSENSKQFDLIDYGYVDYTFYLRCEILKKESKKLLDEKGYKTKSIEIIYEDSDFRQFVIKKVKVFLDKEVINSSSEHIDIIDEVKYILSSYLSIKREVIEVV